MSKKKLDLTEFTPLIEKLEELKLPVTNKSQVPIGKFLVAADLCDGLDSAHSMTITAKHGIRKVVCVHRDLDPLLRSLAKLPHGLDGFAKALTWIPAIRMTLDEAGDYDDDHEEGLPLSAAFIDGSRAGAYAKVLYGAITSVFDHCEANYRYDPSYDEADELSDLSDSEQMADALTELDDDKESLYVRGVFNAVNAIAAAYCATHDGKSERK